MTERKPEPWESSARGPFLMLERERGVVEVWAHGADRFTVRAPGCEQEIVGFRAARDSAQALAARLD